MLPLDVCTSCHKPKTIECPCGTAACKVTTNVLHCPTCQPAASKGELKMHGIAVCQIVVDKELGR